MSWNLAQHLNKFYKLQGIQDTEKFSIVDVIEYLDDAEKMVNDASRTILESLVIDSDYTTSGTGQRLYDVIPSDSLKWGIKEVWYSTSDSDNREKLIPATTDSLFLDYGTDWKDDTGTPSHWYYDTVENKLGVYPYESTVSDGDDCIEIIYAKKHTKMSRYYVTGTASITKGTTAVSGGSTVWIGAVLANDSFGIGRLLNTTTAFPVNWYTVSASATSNTALVLTSAFAETTVSSGYYIVCSPSSIEDETLNLASVYYAIFLANQFLDDQKAQGALQMYSSLVGTGKDNLENTAYNNEPKITSYRDI